MPRSSERPFGPRVRTSVAVVSAILAGLVVISAVVLLEVTTDAIAELLEKGLDSINRHHPLSWDERRLVYHFGGLVAYFVPGLAAAVFFYHFLSYRVGPHRVAYETRCRACFHVLHGPSEPRCPECGEWI